MITKAGILIFPVLAACSSARPASVTRVTPTAPIPAIDAPVAPVFMPVPGEIQRDNRNDPVSLIIVEAQLRFKHGEDFFSQGFPRLAKEQFDSAVDLLLESARDYPSDHRLQDEVQSLVSKVHALELAAIRDGDGFADQPGEHAAIDDLQGVETFPATINPKLKETVENEVRELSHDLPIEINDRVLGFLDYYQNGRGHSTIEAGLGRAGRYQPMIEQILKDEGVPLDLIYLSQAESAFQPRAVSRAKAKGMWQFIPARGKEYGLRQTWWVDERSDPEKSTRAAARHLKDLYQEFGDWYLAMAAYNAGPVRVQQAMEKTGASSFWQLADKRALPRETINYVPNVLALTIIGKNPGKFGFNIQPEPALETERVTVDKATDLRVISEAINLPLDNLRDLNGHLLRWTTPPDDPEFELILPKGYAEKFTSQIASLPESKRILFREHTVRKGDTPGVIARKYGISVTELIQANHLKKNAVVRIGQTLIIPMSGVPVGGATSAAATAVDTASAKPTARLTYIVRRGDTLAKIAALFSVSVTKLKAWNNLSSNNLTIGKKLLVAEQAALRKAEQPAAKKVVHKVQSGETLGKIATAYNTSVDAILSWNIKNDLSVLHPGDQITIFLSESR